jgi:hypothetical protein
LIFTQSKPTNFKLAAATALALVMLSPVGYAHSPEEEQACTPDAMRLCSSEIPDEVRITACMERQKAALSPACKVFFQTPEPVANRSSTAKASKPMSLTPVKFKKPNN